MTCINNMNLGALQDGDLPANLDVTQPEQFMTFVQTQIMPAVTQLGIAGQPEIAINPLYELSDITAAQNAPANG